MNRNQIDIKENYNDMYDSKYHYDSENTKKQILFKIGEVNLDKVEELHPGDKVYKVNHYLGYR